MADGTQYLIELSAKFSGGDAAVSTLADLGDRMLKAGAASEDMDKAAKAMAVSMDDSSSSVRTASSALAEQEQKYRAAEVAADRAAKAVERIGLQADAQTGKLEKAIAAGDVKKVAALEEKIWALAVRQQAATETASTAATALTAEAAAMDVVKVKADAAAASHEALRKGALNVKFAAEEAAKAEAAAAEKTKLAKAAEIAATKKAEAAAVEAAKKAKEAAAEKAKAEKAAASEQAKADAKAKGTGKLGDIAQAFGKLGGEAGGAGQSILGFAGSFGKLGSAMGSAGPYVAIALAIVAIGTAAIATTIAIGKWGVSMADANRSQGLLMDGIARSSEGGGQLADTIDNLTTEVPATRAELMAMAGTLADTGLRGDELSAALETAAIKAARLKFGPDFKEEMLSLSFQAKKLDENLAATFGGLKIDGLLKGLQTLGALFDSSTESGGALKFLFETLFQPLIDGVTAAIPKVERLFLYAVILALQAYIALKPYVGIIEAVGKALLIGAAILVGIFAAAIAVVIVNIALLVAYFAAVTYALYKIGYAVGEALIWIGKLLYAVTFGDKDVGHDMVMGLVNGILNAGGAVVDAMVGVVKNGYTAVTKFLKLGSPSKLMMDVGSDTAEGFTGGVEDGSGGAQGAMEAMVAPPAATASAMSGAAGGAAIVIQQMIVQGENAKELAQDFIEQITRLLEGDARSLGGGEVAHA